MNQPNTWRIARAVSLTFVLSAFGATTFAQQAAPGDPTQIEGAAPFDGAPAAGSPAGDPPGRVARLNYFDGTVTFQPAGGTDWAYAELNRPMTTGDQVWVDNGARSELHIGSTALRLGSQTAVSIVNLDDQSAQLKVAQGTLETRVRALAAGQNFEIDTPNVALQANGPGIYRVDASPDGSSTAVTVRDGALTAYGDNGSVQLGAGQQITFSGTNLQEAGGGTAQALDPFDNWAYSRDRAEDGSVSARYVSRDIPGYQDLDANGSWEDAPDYGQVWVPRVAAGWAPYQQGHWAWVAPWGWTWVDDAPWGFAPFHYGRWAHMHDRWAWVPGPVVATAPPCYSPALVAFVGGGNGGWNVALGVGAVATAGVAWLALGPNEPWHPGYHASPGYFNRVNYVNRTTIVNNTTIINNHNTYVNRNVPGAVIGMPANQFVRGQDTRRYGRAVPSAQVQRASFGAGAPSIAPVRQSFGGALRPANNRPPEAVGQRQVIATRTPPTPFAYRDTLAQSYAHRGGTVPGAGQPVVRTAPPASYMHAPGPANIPGRPGTPAPTEQARGGQPGFHVVQAGHRTPEAGQPGQPGRPANVAGEPARVQPGQPGQPQPGQAQFQGQARPGQPIEPNGARGQSEAGHPEQGQAAREGGVPRPPNAMQQAGRPGAQPGVAPSNAQQEQQQRAQMQGQQAQQREQQLQAQQRGQQAQAQQGQERAQQMQGQQEQQRSQQLQAQQEQQRSQQTQAQQEQQRSQQTQAQQEQQRAQQAQAQQEQQRSQQAQAQQEQQRTQQAQAQQAQQRQQQAQAQQEQQRAQQAQAQQEQQRAQQAQAQQEQQRAQQAQAQQAQQRQQQMQAQQEQQRAQQMQAQQEQQRAQQAQQRQQQMQAQQEQQRAQQAQAQQAQRQQQQEQQRAQQMQQTQQRQQQQQQQLRPQQQREQPQQGHRDQQSSNARDEHRG